MTQKEIIDRESANLDSIWLYQEGGFYKAYERSAFAFYTRIKEYRVLRKESKTLGQDILYIGFPIMALERVLGNHMMVREDDKTLRVVLSYPISENEYYSWRDAQEVEMASRALISPYTKVIEKTPLYKNSYDILIQIVTISKNISKNCQNPFGLQMKRLSYQAGSLVRSVYDTQNEQRVLHIDRILRLYEELSFVLQVLKDTKEISLNSFALLSEQIVSVVKQLSLLRKKAFAVNPVLG